jgi:hypothetical protein
LPQAEGQRKKTSEIDREKYELIAADHAAAGKQLRPTGKGSRFRSEELD